MSRRRHGADERGRRRASAVAVVGAGALAGLVVGPVAGLVLGAEPATAAWSVSTGRTATVGAGARSGLVATGSSDSPATTYTVTGLAGTTTNLVNLLNTAGQAFPVVLTITASAGMVAGSATVAACTVAWSGNGSATCTGTTTTIVGNGSRVLNPGASLTWTSPSLAPRAPLYLKVGGSLGLGASVALVTSSLPADRSAG